VFRENARALTLPLFFQFKLASTLFMSGWYLYTYNEFAFKVLGLVTPVAQAVGNTVKRVVILVRILKRTFCIDMDVECSRTLTFENPPPPLSRRSPLPLPLARP
jgi:hypothetical protein